MVLGDGVDPRFISLQKVSTEESDWSRLHSFHAENSYKTMLARFFYSGVSLPDSKSVKQLASNAAFFLLLSFPTQ